MTLRLTSPIQHIQASLSFSVRATRWSSILAARRQASAAVAEELRWTDQCINLAAGTLIRPHLTNSVALRERLDSWTMVAMAQGWLLLTCCLLLGFMWCPSLTHASRLSTAFRRSSDQYSTTSKRAQIFRGELVHRDHPDSPLRPPPGTTSAQRLAAAAARSQARAARRLGAATATEVHDLTPITPGSGEYLITIHLGTPPQKFVMIVDSGSDLVWVQCLPCDAPHLCFPSPNPYFDPSASSSYAVVPCNSSLCDPNQFNSASCVDSARSCQVSYGYGDGSAIAGDISTDTVALSNSLDGVAWETPEFLFGCMNNDTVSFGSSDLVDGLVGFGRGPNSLPSQLTQSTLNNVFSYCLVPYTAATTLTSALLLGVSSARASYGLPLVYTPILTNDETFYWVSMTGISINGTALDIPSSSFDYNTTTGSGGVIFDSGTTLLILQQAIVTTVVESLQGFIKYPEANATEYGFPLCYNVTGVKHPRFPSMSLHFAGMNGTDAVEFPLTRQNIFIPATDDADVLVECLAVQSTGDDSSTMLVGNIAQADHYVEYDVTNLQLGWTTSVDCSLPLL